MRDGSDKVLISADRPGHAGGLGIGLLLILRRIALSDGALYFIDLAVDLGSFQGHCAVVLSRYQRRARVALLFLPVLAFLGAAYPGALLVGGFLGAVDGVLGRLDGFRRRLSEAECIPLVAQALEFRPVVFLARGRHR